MEGRIRPTERVGSLLLLLGIGLMEGALLWPDVSWQFEDLLFYALVLGFFSAMVGGFLLTRSLRQRIRERRIRSAGSLTSLGPQHGALYFGVESHANVR